MIEYKNILFCTDFSEDANIAFLHALGMAKNIMPGCTSSMSLTHLIPTAGISWMSMSLKGRLAAKPSLIRR